MKSLDGLLAKGKRGLKFGKTLPIYLTLGLAAAFTPINAQGINKQEQVNKSYGFGDANEDGFLRKNDLEYMKQFKSQNDEPDTTAPEITVYDITNPIFSPNNDGVKDTVTIDLEFSEKVDYDIEIIDSSRRMVRYWSGTAQNPKPRPWDGTCCGYMVVPDGVYDIKVSLEDTTGNTFTDTSKTITLDKTPPEISITYPENDSLYTSHITKLRYNLYDENPSDSSWYSTDGQPKTYIPWSSDTTITGLRSKQGENMWIVYAKDEAENPFSSDTVRFNVDTTSVAIAEDPAVPSEYSLSQNYPNPFNSSTRIKYSLPEAGPVSLKVYGMKGRELETLVKTTQSPGYYEVNFNAENLSSGVYFYQLRAGDYTETEKMAVLK